MLNFLKKYGVNEETIKDIENTYDENILYAINSNELEIVKIIDFMKEIGINVIDELLVYNINFFLHKYSEVINKFSKFNLEETKEKINNDYMYINEIMK